MSCPVNEAIVQLRNEECFLNNSVGDFIGTVERVEPAVGGMRGYSADGHSFLWRMPLDRAIKVVEGFQMLRGFEADHLVAA